MRHILEVLRQLVEMQLWTNSQVHPCSITAANNLYRHGYTVLFVFKLNNYHSTCLQIIYKLINLARLIPPVYIIWHTSCHYISVQRRGRCKCWQLTQIDVVHTIMLLCVHVLLMLLICFLVIYSISQEICTRFCCALLSCGYAIIHNEFTWSIYPYSSATVLHD